MESYTYDYPRPALTVDAVVFGCDGGALKALLIQRDVDPFAGTWALPGGFVLMDEDLDTAVRRELQEETGVSNIFLEQLYTFSSIDRDPRGRIVTVAYYALVNLDNHRIQAATDARNAAWFTLDDLPRLAFDHSKILKMAHKRLKGKVRYQPIGFELLPRKFTLTQLQRLYEIILEETIDKRNFRKRILATGLLTELDEVEQDVARRAARLYSFNSKAYKRAIKDGYQFKI